MKIVKVNWLIPLLGVVLVGGGYKAARSFVGFNQTLVEESRFEETIDRMLENERLFLIQAQFQSGGCPNAAGCVAEGLSESVTLLESELASPEERTRTVVARFLEHLAHMRSQHVRIAASLPAGFDGSAAQETLAQAVIGSSVGK